MKVGLKLMERLTLLGILPKESSYALLKVVRKLQEQLAPSEDELKDMEIQEFVLENGERRTQWNREKGEQEVEIEFTSKGADVIKEALTDLDKKKKITLQHVSLWEKFIGDEE